MFKFIQDDEKTDAQNETALNTPRLGLEVAEFELNAGIEIVPSELHTQIATDVPHLILDEIVLSQKKGIKLISVLELLQFKHTRNDVKKILESSSDLISGIYEGGFKTWECTFDLINYLRENREVFTLEPKSRVLDLGCGSGLLGLYTLSFSESIVHFQDYNPEVISFLTIPNVILNIGKKCLTRTKFFSGDWKLFDTFIKNLNSESKYDYILSSETIYNIKSLDKFYKIVLNHLAPSGTLFLAAKTCYFGVGGGTIALKKLIHRDGRMEYEVVDIIREGVQREILCIRFKP